MKYYFEKLIRPMILVNSMNFVVASLNAQEKIPIGSELTTAKLAKWANFTKDKEDWQNTYNRATRMNSLKACFQLFLWEDSLALRQVWWESRNQEVRLFCLSLLSLEVSTDFFEAELSRYYAWSYRFSKEEQNARLLECKYFIKNYKTISGEISKIIPKWGDKQIRDSLLYYRDKHILSQNQLEKFVNSRIDKQ